MHLLAGFDEPSANVHYVLTPTDTPGKVEAGELIRAATLAAAIVAAACTAKEPAASRWRTVRP